MENFLSGQKIILLSEKQQYQAVFEKQIDSVGSEPVIIDKCRSTEEFIGIFVEYPADLVTVDFEFFDFRTLINLCMRLKETQPIVPIVILTNNRNYKDLLSLIRAGAWDYCPDFPGDLSMFSFILNKNLERKDSLVESLRYQKILKEDVEEKTALLKESNEKLLHFNNQLKSIVKSVSILSGLNDMDRLHEKLIEVFVEYTSSAGGSIWEIQEKGLKQVYSIDPGHAPDFLPFPLKKDSVFYKLMETEEYLLIEDEHDLQQLENSPWSGYNHASTLAFPLKDQDGELVALLSLHNKNHPPYTDQDKEIGLLLSSFFRETYSSRKNFSMLEKANDEKITLLKEIHHRVKNNLQVMLSLFNLQSSQERSDDLEEFIRANSNRIFSMALIHENLYRSESFSDIKAGEYVTSLCQALQETYSHLASRVVLKTDLADIKVPLQKAVPFGLILNEILTNSFKYAFPEPDEGEIFLKLEKKDEHYQITVCDNGVGFERENTSSGSIGLLLIESLMEQLEGHYELTTQNGTCYILNFPQ